MLSELNDSINNFALNLRSKGKQNATIESYKRDAQNFLEFLHQNSFPLGDVSTQTLLDFQTYLKEVCHEKENTIRRAIIGVRQFFRYLEAEKIIPSSPLNLSIIPPRIEDLPPDLSDEDIDKLIEQTKNSTPPIKSLRDTAILCLLALEGLKAAEIIGLKWRDYLGATKRGSMKISGNRSRVVLLSEQTTLELNKYEKMMRQIQLNDHSENHMFIAFKGRDASIISNQISRHGIKFMLYELGEKINKSFLNTELLRHYAINKQIASGRSPAEIMNHLGLKRMGNIAKHFAKANNKKKVKNEH